MYKLDYYGSTEKGRRPKNEDSFLIFVNNFGNLIAIIADGMGGHKGGEMASKAVVKMIKKELIEVNFNNYSSEEAKVFLLTKIRVFQKDLKRIGVEFPEYNDMGTTLNMNIFSKDSLFTINIGDSRTQSFIKKDINKITIDHNLATLAEIDPRFAHYKGQSNMLTSSLGPNKNTNADFFLTKLVSDNGYILMSTDGVHNYISDISLMKIIKSNSKTMEEKVDAIIEKAYNNNSNDNMTFILINYKKNKEKKQKGK